MIADCRFDFSGANVAVTGGGQGLGRAYAKAFAEVGATVFILERNYQNACNVVSEITESGGQAIAYELDVGNAKDITQVFEKVIAQYSSIDVLINNAAIFTTLDMKPFYEIDPDEWRDVINVNLNGVYQCSRQVVDAMRHNGFGNSECRIGCGNYGASKLHSLCCFKIRARGDVALYGKRIGAVWYNC